jgi:FkbM family methyltransferase
MTESFSIKLGKFLYKNAFPLYNIMYPVFKKRQDARELKLIASFVKPGFNVLDIGANIGFYTRVLSNLAGPQGNVYAFEPEDTNFKYLKQNLSSNKNVHLINKAVSDKTEPIKIYLSKMLNVDHRTYPVDDYANVIEIQATTIDDYLAANNITKIDFIKMDIQGFEMSAFKGMIGVLTNNPSLKIITEFWPFGLKKAGSSALEIMNLAHAQKFDIYLITPDKLQLLSKQMLTELKQDEDSYYNVLWSKEKLNN